jgi:hypothetical protein
MAISREATRQFSADYPTVFRAACDAALAEGMTIQTADSVTGAVYVTTPMSMASWGEKTTLRVWVDSGFTHVGVRSSLKFGLVDWGKNRKNIDRLFTRMELLLSAGAGH